MSIAAKVTERVYYVQGGTGVASAANEGFNSNAGFVITDEGGKTEVHISADVQITGKIATFGHRIIAAKAEQVTVAAIRNVEDLLAARAGR